jgi:Glycosyl transferase family 2
VIEETHATSRPRAVAVVATDGTTQEAQARAAEISATGHHVTLVTADDLDIEVTPPYLRESYALCCALRGREVSAIVFPDTGGLAYCAARARQAGIAFEATTIVIACAAPTLRSFTSRGGVFLSKRLLGSIAAERLALELADGLVCPDDDVRYWYEHSGWMLPPRLVSWHDLGSPPRPELESADRPVISVVVPYHERTDYLLDCLEGLARQTYPSLEVLIADDGSSSRAAVEQLRMVEQRSWPWPLRVTRQAHGGLGAARNGGWRASGGELVAFIDDDDVPFDELIETLWRARVTSGSDIVVAGARFFRGDGPPTEHRGDVIRISLCEPRELGLISNQYGGPVNLWPRNLLEELGGFASVPNEDWDLLARATFYGARISTPPDPLYWYRQTPGSMYSADPAAFRDAGVPSLSERFAAHLPAELRLVPQLAAGAYSELERRKRAERSSVATLKSRVSLMAARTRQVWEQDGAGGVAKGVARLTRRRV